MHICFESRLPSSGAVISGDRFTDLEADMASNRSLHSSSYKKADAETRVGAD